jgi:hypothetical protein
VSRTQLRPFLVGLTIVFLVLAALEAVVLFRIIDSQNAVGGDLAYYRFVGQRWLETGVYYTPHQLSGPYEVQTQVDNLYPPHALYLFVPFIYLPAILWWIVPLAIMAWVVWWCRPALWGLPILAAIVLFPKTPNQIIYGNTDMWIGAAIAAGVRWGWPSTLVSFKPSLAFFALLGIRGRSWWVAVAGIVLASLPLISLWLLYPTVMRNSSAQFTYSLSNLPFFCLPIVAWLSSTRRGTEPMRRWFVRLGRGGEPSLGSGAAPDPSPAA